MNNKKIIIIAVALIAIIVILAGTAAALLSQPKQDAYTVYLNEGYRYLLEGDYNNAILQFRLAMDKDGTREDAYVGLYQAYLHSGQWEYAETTLRIGISSTRSSELQQLLLQLEGLYDQHHPDQQEETKPEEPDDEDKTIQPIMNTELLGVFSSANYGDYCAQYGAASNVATNGRFSRYLESIGATLIYYDTSVARVIDTSRGVPYSQFLPNEIWLDNISTAFGGSKRITFDTLKMLPGVTEAVQQEDTITFRYGGCEVSVVCKEKGVITDGCSNKIVPLNTEGTETSQYQIQTVICDATNNAPIGNVRVRIYKGSGAYGAYQEGITDSSGKVTINLEGSGEYTVVAEKDGYVTEQFQAIVLSNMAMTIKNFYLSPVMRGEGVRFVLTWNASPSDLDSHLIGTTGEGRGVHVFFGEKAAMNSSGSTIADLDVDDTDGYGPETMTLYDTSGSFEFIVDDYTDSGTISTSGATVKIYVGSTLYTTVSIVPGIQDQWHVCTVVNGEIMVTNRSN